MASKSVCVFFVAVWISLVVCYNAGEHACTKVNNCSCKFANGSVIDISPVGFTDGKPRFGYDKALGTGGNGDHTGFKYAFNPCFGFNDTWRCDNVVGSSIMGCQTQNASDGIGIFYYPLGKPDSAEFSEDGTAITYQSVDPSDGITRTSKLLLACDHSVKMKHPKFYRLGEFSDQTIKAGYLFLLVSECACAGGCSSEPPYLFYP